MAFVIGAIVVVLAVVAWFVFARGAGPDMAVPESIDADVDINLPEAPKMPEMPANPVPAPAE